MTADEPGEPSSSARVEAARDRQLTRYVGARSPYNSALDGRTVADLAASGITTDDHVAEALAFR